MMLTDLNLRILANHDHVSRAFPTFGMTPFCYRRYMSFVVRQPSRHLYQSNSVTFYALSLVSSSIFTKGHMKSSLDGRPSTFSDSSFGTVCLVLFVDCFSWPNLTAACAAQVAKQGVLSSFRHGYTFWRARCRFRNRGLVTILVHLSCIILI